MRKMLTIATAVIADAGRRKVVWVVVLFAGLLALVVPSLPSYGQGVVGAVYREVTIALMFAASFVVALSLSANRIPGEVERRTVFNVLSRDVRRWEYVAGTWLGIFCVVGLSVLAFTVVALVAGQFVYQQFMWQLLEASVAVWFEMGVLIAVTVLMSTRFGVVTTLVGALAFTFVGHAVGSLIVGAPWWLPTLELFNVINPVAHGNGVTPVYLLAMSAAFVAWIGLLLLGASALFEGRDL